VSVLWLFLAVLFVGIAIGMPIAFSLGLAAMVMMVITDTSASALVAQAIAGVNSFPLLAIPFFILAGEIMSTGGIARRLVNFASALVGFIYGGLGQVSVAASMFFGGISGSAIAEASAIGSMMIPPMKQQRYTPPHATAIVCAAAVIGLIIPPSIPMILYGIATGTSIGRLFAGGIIPGILIGIVLMVTTSITAKRYGVVERQPFSFGRLVKTFREAILSLLLPVIIVGGILSGFFTATEAAVVAVFYALVVEVAIYREIQLRDLSGMLLRTARVTGIVLLLLAMAAVVAWFLTNSRVPQGLVASATGFSTNPYVILFVLSGLLLLIGTVMDITPAIVILAPIMAPVAQAAGVDTVYFGVLMSFVLGIGMITPPVGTVLFVGSGIGGVSLEQLVRELVPFYVAYLVVLLLLIMFPQLILWLPYATGARG
jgi:TRAP-type transport system large permease protein